MTTFIIVAVLLLASALAAVLFRNLVHSVLALTITFASLAVLYLQLGAQFLGFAQLLIYVGAVAILVVFAILLTRGSEPPSASIFSPGWLAGLAVALLVFCVMAGALFSSPGLAPAPTPAPSTGVAEIGKQLMTKYVLPLEVVGLLLTAALLGAVLIASRDHETTQRETQQPTASPAQHR